MCGAHRIHPRLGRSFWRKIQSVNGSRRNAECRALARERWLGTSVSGPQRQQNGRGEKGGHVYSLLGIWSLSTDVWYCHSSSCQFVKDALIAPYRCPSAPVTARLVTKTHSRTRRMQGRTMRPVRLLSLYLSADRAATNRNGLTATLLAMALGRRRFLGHSSQYSLWYLPLKRLLQVTVARDSASGETTTIHMLHVSPR